MPIPSNVVDTHLGAGRASFHMENLPIADHHDIVTALSTPGVVTPSVVSFDVEWRSQDPLVKIHDAGNGFAGQFMTSLATIQWSASQPSTNFVFQSDSASTSTTISGVIGHEHNGLFLPGPD